MTEAGLTDVLDEALLLTTELSTNGVIHACTDLDLEIVVDAGSITVGVMDFRTGPLTASLAGPSRSRSGPPGEADLDERGRGLLLVDRLASSWGTVHHPGGKGVWFRLDRPNPNGHDPEPRNGLAALAPTGLTVAGSAPVPALTPETLAELNAPSALANGAALADIGQELLKRLCGVIHAAGAAVVIDEGDGRGPQVAAGYGVSAANVLQVPLPLTRPWRGELTLAVNDTALARTLAEFTAERIALLVENQRLRRSDLERRGWLTFLAEASELLAQSLDVGLTMALIPQLVVPRLGEWCAIHTADDGGELRLAAATHADESELTTLLDALEGALPQVREARQTDAVVPLAAPVEGYAVGLVARGQQLGVLSVGRRGDHWQSPEEVAVVEDVARRAALAVDNARIHAERHAVAQALQRSLLPPRLPEVAGIDFGAEYVPTGGGVDVGGDFYDVVALPDNRWLVVVGDVSGKGVQAATVTGLVRDVTRVLIRDGRPLPEALARLNDTLVERGGGRFCTLALAAVTPGVRGRLDVSLYLAGHDQPVLLHADGTTSLVGACGTALGLLTAISSPLSSVCLEPGDTLVFYTDGVTERRRGLDLFGVDRLRHEAAALAGFPADVVAARLRAAALGFSSEVPRDDIAIFALRNDAPV
jgi:serine phosphatase RsbU (regulator of sigma subunit)/anti-sigma regulatory factor (Ser/Thr protein kinase)